MTDRVRLASDYLARADELAKDMEKHGYGVVLTFATLALAHLQLAAQWAAECDEFGCRDEVGL